MVLQLFCDGGFVFFGFFGFYNGFRHFPLVYLDTGYRLGSLADIYVLCCFSLDFIAFFVILCICFCFVTLLPSWMFECWESLYIPDGEFLDA